MTLLQSEKPALTIVPETVLSHRDRRMAVKAKSPVQTAYEYDARTTELLTMLRAMRPAGSVQEREFVEQWVAPLGTDPDAYGNHWLIIGDSRILWSCHTDTVHKRGGTQYVGFRDGCAYVKKSNCLGADDTTGVWLMRNMILAGVPGTYVFHRGEEIGGLGSNWILDNSPERLAGIDCAIAFDRMGYSDIIVTQMDDTASETFSTELQTALWPLPYASADGIFTDTAVYSGTISECSNISVGYHNQHTGSEWQDVDFAMVLLDTIVKADFSGLQAHRDPTVDTAPWWDRYERDDRSYGLYGGAKPGHRTQYQRDIDALWGSDGSITSMDQFCREYPDVVSDFLTCCGHNLDELKEYGGIT